MDKDQGYCVFSAPTFAALRLAFPFFCSGVLARLFAALRHLSASWLAALRFDDIDSFSFPFFIGERLRFFTSCRRCCGSLLRLMLQQLSVTSNEMSKPSFVVITSILTASFYLLAGGIKRMFPKPTPISL